MQRVAFATGHGPPIRTDVAVPGALEAVRALFPQGPAEAPGAPPDFALVETDEGFLIEVDRGAWTAPHLSGALTRLELLVAEEMVRRSGLPALHAGGVTLDAGALLVAGPSGSGKSSLTAGLAARGLPVMGDDAVLLGLDGTVHPLRRRLKVAEPARTLLGLPAPSGPLARLWPDSAFYDPADLGSRWSDPAPVRAVVLPTRVSEGVPSLRRIEPAVALGELLGHVLLRERVSPEAFDAAAEALGAARCYRLDYDAAPAAVETLVLELG